MCNKTEFLWKDIYEQWIGISTYFPSIRKKLLIHKIQINNWNSDLEFFHGYDWISNENFESRTNYVVNQPTAFLMFGDKLNKGTLTTLAYLVEAEDDQTRAAIWIYAFTQDIQEYRLENWHGEANRIIYAVKTAAELHLINKDIRWHHAMRKLLPDICFSYPFLESLNISNMPVVMEMVAIAVDYIHLHYNVSEYDSREPNEVR